MLLENKVRIKIKGTNRLEQLTKNDMHSLTCIIVDQDAIVVNILAEFIYNHTQWAIKGNFCNALEALEFLKLNTVDFIITNTNMQELSGMELAALLPVTNNFIFITANRDYASESYNFNTVDYIVKPLTLKRFLLTTQKISQFFNRGRYHESQQLINANTYFFVKSGKTLRKIYKNDILYFEGEREYVRIVTLTEQVLIYKRLKDIENQLSDSFIRIHNSYIINSVKLEKIQDNHIYIGDKNISITDKFRESVMELIQQRLF